MGKTVFISKLGIKTHWNPSGWSVYGGDSDWVSICVALFNANPDVTFYYCQTSDKDKLTAEQYRLLFPHDNVVWPFDEVRFGKDPIENENVLLRWFEAKGVRPDIAVMDTGTSFFTAFYNTMKSDRARNGEYLTPASMVRSKYSPQIRVVEAMKLDTITLCFDPRSTLMFRDWWNRPRVQLSQLNLTYISDLYNREKEVQEQIENHMVYAGLQESVLIGHTPEPIEDLIAAKTKKFGIVCHQCGNDRGARDRTPMIREFILDGGFEEVEIYGKWNDQFFGVDPRFKGPLPKVELDAEMRKWRYSFCVPLGDGWATTKYLELIKQGVIPFLHPNYDVQRNAKLPEYLYVKDARDLREKIEDCERDGGAGYKRLVTQLYERFMSERMLDGTDLIGRISSYSRGAIPSRWFEQNKHRIRDLWKKFDELEKAKISSLDWF